MMENAVDVVEFTIKPKPRKGTTKWLVLIDGVEQDLDQGTARVDEATKMIVNLYAEHHWRKARKL